jgi:hypothetical protein
MRNPCGFPDRCGNTRGFGGDHHRDWKNFFAVAATAVTDATGSRSAAK